MISNHVLEVSVKLKFQCVRFEKEHCFALVALNCFLICFIKTCSPWFTRYDLYHTVLLYDYAEAKEMIYESVNMKGVVYEPSQNSFILFRFFIKFIH